MPSSLEDILEKIEDIGEAKSEMRDSIQGKGVSIPAGALLSGYSDYIDEIEIAHPDIPLNWIATSPQGSFTTDYKTVQSTNTEFKAQLYPCPNSSDERWIICSCRSGVQKSDSRKWVWGNDIRISNTALYSRYGMYDSNYDSQTVTASRTFSNTYVQGKEIVYKTSNSEGKAQLTINGTTFSSSSAISSSGTLFPNLQMHIFGMCEVRGEQGYCWDTPNIPGMKLWYLKIFEGSTLKRHYLPVLHWSKRKNGYVPLFKDQVTGGYTSECCSKGYSDSTLTYNVPYYIPQGDTELEYIAAGPDSKIDTRYNVWFDTGYTPRVGTAVELKGAYVMNNSSSNKFAKFFGCRVSSSSANGFWLGGYEGNGTQLNGRIGSSVIGAWSPQNNAPFVFYGKLESSTSFNAAWDKNPYGTTASDVTQVTKTTSTSGTTFSNFYLFKRSQGSVEDGDPSGGVKIYGVKIWENDALVKFFVPVLHEGTPCFYEMVSKTYIYNKGTDTPSYKIY